MTPRRAGARGPTAVAALAVLVTACEGAGRAGGSAPDRGVAVPAPAAPGRAEPPRTTASPSTVPPTSGEGLVELVASANRRMMHGDGAGCLADLDRIDRGMPAVGETLAVVRGQCEMLVGRCQAGKRRVAAYHRSELAFSEERAAAVAESLAAMRCRGGDATERDELLRALWELSQGAYVEGRAAAECERSIATVRRLAPRVQPRDPDDGQVRGGPQALFHTGAACLARAGDCGAAFRVWSESYPASSLDAVPDPKVRRQVISDGFRSSIARCKDAALDR